MQIGIVCPEGGLFGPVTMRLAVTQAAEQRRILTSHVLVTEESPDATEVVSHLRAAKVDGVVILRWTKGMVDLANQLKGMYPTVIISGSALARDEFGVQILQRLAAEEITHHLLGANCANVAHFAGPEHWIDGSERAIGWANATSGVEGCRLIHTRSWGSQGAYTAAREQLEMGWVPDGVFAANDLIALGVMKAVSEAGLRIPDDVAVAGFDSIAGSESFIPPLTSAEVPFASVGKASVDQLLALLEGNAGGVVSYRPRLIIRESSDRESQTVASV